MIMWTTLFIVATRISAWSPDRNIKRKNVSRQAERLICTPSDYTVVVITQCILRNNETRDFRESDTTAVIDE